MSREQPSQNFQEQAPSKTRTERLKGWTKKGAVALGLTVVAGAGVNHYAGSEAIAGRAVSAAERHETESDPTKYYRSEERNDRIKGDAEKFAKRMVENANKHPELVSSFDDADPATGKKDGKGLLTTQVKQGNRTYSFTVSAKKGGEGYEVSSLDTQVKAEYSEPGTYPDTVHNKGAEFSKHGDERNDGMPTWDAMGGESTSDSAGTGMGGSYESSLVAIDRQMDISPDMSPQNLIEMMSQAEQAATQDIGQIMEAAHV